MPNALKIFSYETAPTLVFYTRILKRKKKTVKLYQISRTKVILAVQG